MSESTFTDIPLLRGPVALSHLLLRHFVQPGDSVVDATCGNGNDTLLLAGLVGPTGRVWAFDIQQKAIEATAAVLTRSGHIDSVELVNAGHETMTKQCAGPVKAVVFNLGYLPGSDHSIITHPVTTAAALEQSLKILATGGIVVITIYPGHEGGVDEQRVVDDWASRLEAGRFHSWRMMQLNVPSDAPYVMCVQKAS